MENLPQFMPGIDLNRLYFQQVVKPLLDKHFPRLVYSAGLLGEGSDVLRYDTPTSMDHNWGPHVRIFLSESDFRQKRKAVDEMLRHELPYDFLGFPTNFTKPDENAYLVQQMKPTRRRPINHLIQFYTIGSFFKHYLGFDPYATVTIRDWLTFPQQALIEVSRGELYYDGLEVEKIRQTFQYYPEPVWLWMYMIQWGKIGDLLSSWGRSGQVGDEVGSATITADMVSKVMRLCFLIEKTYWPYLKWFGTGFSRLKCAPELTPLLLEVVHARDWREREEKLEKVMEKVAEMHNALRITTPIQTKAKSFHGRNFRVFDVAEVYHKLEEKLTPPFKRLRYRLGNVDQFVDHPRLNHLDYAYKEFRPLIK